MNVNIGHQHPMVVKAIQDQAAKLCYAHPGIGMEPRRRLAEIQQRHPSLGDVRSIGLFSAL